MGTEVRGFCNETLGAKLTLVADILLHINARHDDELTPEQIQEIDMLWSRIYDLRQKSWKENGIAYQSLLDRNAASRYRGIDERSVPTTVLEV
jgi:hypothetical protein